MSDERILTLTKKGNELYLNNMKLTGWENYRIIQDSALPTGKAELEIKLIVDFLDVNKNVLIDGNPITSRQENHD